MRTQEVLTDRGEVVFYQKLWGVIVHCNLVAGGRGSLSSRDFFTSQIWQEVKWMIHTPEAIKVIEETAASGRLVDHGDLPDIWLIEGDVSDKRDPKRTGWYKRRGLPVPTQGQEVVCQESYA
jgi:hypothetical protein